MSKSCKILYLGQNRGVKSIIGLNDLVRNNSDYSFFVVIGVYSSKNRDKISLKQKIFKRFFNNFEIQLSYDSLEDLCKAKNIPYQVTNTPRHLNISDEVRNFQPDFLISNGWGWIISDEVINLPKVKALNCHSSLLPNYRGGSVYKHVLMNYEEKTGLSLHELTSKIDRGVIYAQKEVPIDKSDTPNKLLFKLSLLSAQVISEGIENILSSSPKVIKNEGEGFYAKKTSVKEYVLNKLKNKIRVTFGFKPKKYAVSKIGKKSSQKSLK